MNRHPRRRVSEFDIELDGYESVISSEDFDEDYVDGEFPIDGDIDGEHGENPFDHINIQELHHTESEPLDVPNTEDPFKNTELVLKFNPKIRPQALRWFIKRVVDKRRRGGAELLLRREPYEENHNEGLVVHVTASSWRLLEVAETLEIQKKDFYKDAIRPFQLLEVMNFLEGSMDISDILSPAEKQMAVAHELKNIVARPGEKAVPGYEHIRLQTGQSIFHVFTTKELIVSYFALHQQEDLKKLESKWYMSFWDESPYEDIRAYFGDSTSLYFNFLAYFSFCLTVPAVIGLFMKCLPDAWFHHLVFLFCIVNMLFVTVFEILWQRYQSRITYEWGTLQGISTVWEQPRENYVGVQSVDPVTGLVFKKFPYQKVAMRTYGVSFPVVAACCGGALACMYKYLEYEVIAKQYSIKMLKENTKWPLFWAYAFPLVPVLIYSILVLLLTKIYRRVANVLTEWENHRTETQFERHLVLKMVVFEVANCFSMFIYTAFVMNDAILLQKRLSLQLMVMQTGFVLEQCFVPVIFRSSAVKIQEFLESSASQLSSVFSQLSGSEVESVQKAKSYPGLEGFNIDVMDLKDYRVQMSKVEELMVPYQYEEDFDEYLNLFLQFGYTFMFSSVYPLAAGLALVNNIILLYMSLYKRRAVYQRALARRVNGIGAWAEAFELLGVFSVISNCALLSINKPLRANFPGWTDFQWMLLFVFIEHLIMALQYAVRKVFPKVPMQVKVSLARLEFRSRMAYKREAMDKARRRRVGQVFDPINRYMHERPRSASTVALAVENKEQRKEVEVKPARGSLKLSNNAKPNTKGGKDPTKLKNKR